MKTVQDTHVRKQKIRSSGSGNRRHLYVASDRVALANIARNLFDQNQLGLSDHCDISEVAKDLDSVRRTPIVNNGAQEEHVCIFDRLRFMEVVCLDYDTARVDRAGELLVPVLVIKLLFLKIAEN